MPRKRLEEVVQLPARVGSKVFMSGQQTANRINQAIGRPKEYAKVPAPPDVILRGGLDRWGSPARAPAGAPAAAGDSW